MEWPRNENDAIAYVTETVRDHPWRLIEVITHDAASLFDLLDDQGLEPPWLVTAGDRIQNERYNMTTIDRFEGQHAFLSNFFRHVKKIPYNYEEWPTAEHAFQAAKASKPLERLAVLQCKSPADAKKRGRRVKLRIGWDEAKQGIMLEVIRAKFSHPQLRGLLLATGDAELIEGNSHNDTYWGVCKGVGENHLGKILMQVRDEVNAAKTE